MPQNENLISIEMLSDEIKTWRKFVPAKIYPFKAIALARAITNIPANVIADVGGISRSYLAALENYAKPIPPDADGILDKIFSSRNSDIEEFLNILSILIDIDEINHTTEYFSFLHEKLSDLEPKIIILIFETLSSLKEFFEILYYDIYPEDTYEEIYNDMLSAGLVPIDWPQGKIPKMIIANQKSILPAFLFNLVSPEQIAARYQAQAYKRNPFSSAIFMDRTNLFLPKNVSLYSISSLVAFFFKEIRISIDSSKIFPLEVEIFFMNKWYDSNRISNLHHLFTKLCEGRIEDKELDDVRTMVKMGNVKFFEDITLTKRKRKHKLSQS